PRTGTTEPAPFLRDDHTGGQRTCGGKTTGPERVDGGQGTGHTERSVDGATVGHRVQMGAGGHRAGTGGAPPGPQVAVAVRTRVQSTSGGRIGEPGTGLGIGPRPGETVIAPADGGTSDGGQICPAVVEVHTSSLIGTRMPWWSATRSASS